MALWACLVVVRVGVFGWWGLVIRFFWGISDWTLGIWSLVGCLVFGQTVGWWLLGLACTEIRQRAVKGRNC